MLGAKQGGNYTVEVTSPIGCSKMSDPFTVTIHPAPVVNLGGDTAVLPDQQISLNAGAGFNAYLWSTGQTLQSITVDSSGVGIGVKTVWVQVTDNFSCKGRDTILINFTPHPSVFNHQNDAAVAIYPNPSDGRFYVKINGITGKANIYITNIAGQMISHEQFILAGEMVKEYNLGHLTPGVYFIRLHTAEAVVTQQLIMK